MKSIAIKLLTATFVISLTSALAMAGSHGSSEEHGDMGHGAMNQSHENHSEMSHGSTDHDQMGHDGETATGKAMGVGVIHRVSKLNRMVNLTHEPIPALNWPEMTMDLPVAKSVDLENIKTGEEVKFHIELGPDNKFIITDIMQ